MARTLQIVQRGIARFLEDECTVHGASLAYYTIFSLPPLLVIVFLVAEAGGASPETIDRFARRQIGIPAPAAGEAPGTFTTVAERASIAENTSLFGRLLGLGILVFSATGVLGQLQRSLNAAWDVAPSDEKGAWWTLLVKRLLSLAMIVVVGLILLVSLALSALVDDFARSVAADTGLAVLLDQLLGFAVAVVVFAAVYKFLPDARVEWRQIWFGAIVTAVLFTIGKGLLGWHLRTAASDSPWGAAAGSMIAMLVWVYYSSLIVLLGAELTRAWVDVTDGRKPDPEPGAVAVDRNGGST